MLKFHDGTTIHGNAMCGDTLYITFQQGDDYPERVIPLSRAAAIVQARSILQQLAPRMLANPERALVAADVVGPVVIPFPVRPVLVDVLGSVR